MLTDLKLISELDFQAETPASILTLKEPAGVCGDKQRETAEGDAVCVWAEISVGKILYSKHKPKQKKMSRKHKQMTSVIS